MDINTCFATTESYHTIAYYSHLIPVAIASLLVIFVLVNTKSNLLSKIFALFVGGFSFWLLADAVIWTNQNYHMVTWLWSLMDYINVVFYLLAAYFFLVFLNEGKDISNWVKAILFVLTLPALWITISGQSIVDFYQPWCEASNNELLTYYKLAVEMVSLAVILISGAHSFFISSRDKKKQISIVALALMLFLTIFASTEYIASQTGIYEINLYSLFVLPVFLAMIIYSVTNLKIFAFKTFGTQLLVGILLIMVGSQFFFLSNTTDKALTLITFGLSLFLGVILLRNVHREEIARREIERLAIDLQVANEGQSNLLHIINHQIKGYLAKARNIFSELISDPDYGPIPVPAKPMLDEGFKDLTEGVNFVQDFLTAANIEKGTYKYEMIPVDFKAIVEEMAENQKSSAQERQLNYEVKIEEGNYTLVGDKAQISQAVRNLIDNSIKYTLKGGLTINLANTAGKILFYVQDTGVGISEELKPKLFTKGGRDKDSQKINVNSTGFGLAFVKGVAEAHGGRVWAESPGPGKGSTFYMELPVK
jgi:signal transduction histidine kinase